MLSNGNTNDNKEDKYNDTRSAAADGDTRSQTQKILRQ